jgi:hypothetical protein
MAANIPISGRARKYGYIIWSAGAESEIKKVLKDKDQVKVIFDGSEIGEVID